MALSKRAVSDGTDAFAHVTAQVEQIAFKSLRQHQAGHSFGFVEATRVCIAGAPL